MNGSNNKEEKQSIHLTCKRIRISVVPMSVGRSIGHSPRSDFSTHYNYQCFKSSSLYSNQDLLFINNNIVNVIHLCWAGRAGPLGLVVHFYLIPLQPIWTIVTATTTINISFHRMDSCPMCQQHLKLEMVVICLNTHSPSCSSPVVTPPVLITVLLEKRHNKQLS